MVEAARGVSFGQYRELLARYLAPQWRLVLLLALLLFGNLALRLINPQILRHFIDSLGADAVLSRLIVLAVVFTGVALVQQVVTVVETYVAGRVAWTATNFLRTDLARHALSLDMSYHNSHTPGEMIERVDGDPDLMAQFLSTFAISLLGSGLLLLGILGLLFREDWRAGGAIGVFVAVSFLVLLSLRNYTGRHWRAAREATADAYGFLEERIGGTEDIRTSGAKSHVMVGLFKLTRRWFRRFFKAFMISSIANNSGYSIFGAGNAIALATGAYLFLDGSITIGTVYLIFHYSNMLEQPVRAYVYEMNALQRATGSIHRILELTRTSSRVVDGPGASLPQGPLAASFDDVSFAYDAGTPVLEGVGFELAPGRTLGLLGRTGSGKTTLSRLLLRLYDPAGGIVRLGGVDVRRAKVNELRSSVSMVTQDVQLFHGTVRDNLTFFDRSISDGRVLEVANELGLAEWFASMPLGLDTTLQAGGGGFSAGEAQLLAFTRVFLTDARLIVLDEASSRLDRGTEALVQNALRRLEEERTVIIIAHHLVTVQRVDEVMILQGGRVLEHVTAGLTFQACSGRASRRCWSEYLAFPLAPVPVQAGFLPVHVRLPDNHLGGDTERHSAADSRDLQQPDGRRRAGDQRVRGVRANWRDLGGIYYRCLRRRDAAHHYGFHHPGPFAQELTVAHPGPAGQRRPPRVRGRGHKPVQG